MQRRLLTAAPVIVAMCSILAGTAAMAQGLPSEFVAGYRKALQSMQDTYQKATIRGTIRTQDVAAGTSLEQRFIMRTAGNWSRLDATTTAQKGAGAIVGQTDVTLATPESSLQSTRTPGAKMLSNDMQEDNFGDAVARIRDTCPLKVPYTMGTQGTVLEMLQRGDVKITSFKIGKRDGEPMIQIAYDQQVDPDGRYGPWKCTLLISPDEGYALRDYSRTTGHGSRQMTVRGSLSYSVDRSGVPLLQRFQELTEQAGVVAQRRTVNISEFDTERPVNGYFTADGL